jgi:hypothetical protein
MVVPSRFASDAKLRIRIEREAKAIAAIPEHDPPHIDGEAPLDRLIRACLDQGSRRADAGGHAAS